jgi:hypothetical protein
MAAPERRFSIGGTPGRAEWLWIGVILFAYALAAALIVKEGGPLGHDESVYALRARDFHDGATPGPYWEDYRAPGLPWLLRHTVQDHMLHANVRSCRCRRACE